MLYLGGHPIPVRWVKNLGLEHGMAGCFIMPDKVIQLDADMDQADIWETLIHEAVHAVSAINRLQINEAKTRQLGFGLHSMFAGFLPEL